MTPEEAFWYASTNTPIPEDEHYPGFQFTPWTANDQKERQRAKEHFRIASAGLGSEDVGTIGDRLRVINNLRAIFGAQYGREPEPHEIMYRVPWVTQR